LASLDADMAAGLASQARPKASLPRPSLGKALSEEVQPASFFEGYVLGRALGFLDRFGPRAADSAELRQQISETLLCLEPAIRAALPEGEQASRLVGFATDLANNLRSGQIDPSAASRRLQVFGQAMREALQEQASLRGGLRLGLLVQGWQTQAHADALGIDVALQDAAALKRARQAIRSDPGLSAQMRRSVLQDLTAIQSAQTTPHSKPRAAQILSEIDRLDQRLRASR
jgi:hypothetical protein